MLYLHVFNWPENRTVVLGDLSIPNAGKTTPTVKPTSAPHGAVMNLKSVTLRLAL
jgi:hypothetical protein